MKSLIVCIDIDGTVADVGDRFVNNPPPASYDRNTSEYNEWLDKVQTDELLLKDKPVPGMQEFVSAFPECVYLTSRSIKMKDITLRWLRLHGFPPREIIMRDINNNDPYDIYKEKAIKGIILRRSRTDKADYHWYNVLVVDDDPKGKLKEVCLRNNWNLHKAECGGKTY